MLWRDIARHAAAAFGNCEWGNANDRHHIDATPTHNLISRPQI